MASSLPEKIRKKAKSVVLSERYKPSSMWSFYFMIKATVQSNHSLNVDYPRVNSFLKKCGVGFVLVGAPDNNFLDTKVILVFGIYGATRADELTNVRVEDITMQGDVFLVKITKTKTNLPPLFTIEGEYAKIVKSYIALRPAKTDSFRFFVKYQNGKCVNQVIGRNKILGTPKKIAMFLGLENPQEYTGHSLRCTSATTAADGGASMIAMKQHGGWLSEKMVEHYIANSVETKRKMGNIITKRIQSKTTSTVVSQSAVVQANSMATAPMPMDVEPQDMTTIATVTPSAHSVAADAIVTPNDSIAPNFDVAFKDQFFNAAPTRTTADRDIGKYVMNFKDCKVSINYK